MSQIIAATDFSEVAGNAVHYACQLAMEHHVPVTILHSFIIPVTFSDTPMPMIPVDEGIEIAEGHMRKFVSTLKTAYPELELFPKVMYGEITDCLEDLASESKPWLIVVGNGGAGDASSWLGSNVISILKHQTATVVAVPPDVTYKKAEKLCFAYDLKHISEAFNASDLTDLVLKTGAQLHVLNVDTEKNQAVPEFSFESTVLYSSLATLNPVYHHVESENTDDSIAEFVASNHMDWLIILPQRHSFFEGLFHKSHTKAMVRKIHVPLVALHDQ